VLAVAAALIWWRPAVPAGAWRWWLGSVAVFGAGVAGFDGLIYGGPLRSGYRPVIPAPPGQGPPQPGRGPARPDQRPGQPNPPG
jgi:hypothetical protein